MIGFLLASCGPKQPAAKPPPAADLQFTDVTARSGIQFERVNGAFGRKWMPETFGGGGAFIDYDNDGFQDILLINGDWWPGHNLAGPRPTLRLYHNNGNGTFTDATEAMGLGVSLQGMGVAVGDFDNDGFDDVVVTSVGAVRLFRNDHGKRFVDVTAQSGIKDAGWSTSAAWLDYDGDGLLDLFVCNYVLWSPATDRFCGSVEKAYCEPTLYEADSCHLFHNEGGGRFRDVSREAGLGSGKAKALGVCVADVDGDGTPDIIVANDLVPNMLYQNQGGRTYKEIGFASGIAVAETSKPRGGMGIDTSFYKRDNSLALAIGNFTNEGIAFFERTPGTLFEERSSASGVRDASLLNVTFGLFFADFHNDGWPDLFAANGHIDDSVEKRHPLETYRQPALLFRNRRDGTFEEMSKRAGADVTKPLLGRAAVRGDFDNDGGVDVLIVQNFGPCVLLHNESPRRGHWLEVLLHGTKSNRDGYGATVTVESGGATSTLYAASGSSYLCANDRRLHFGLGPTAGEVRVTVKWPRGAAEVWPAVPADRVVKLVEGSAPKVDNAL